MQYRKLGHTGIEVSRLCFGTLVMGPLQKNLSQEEGGALLARAYSLGVNFIDTAELYQTYAHVRESIRQYGAAPIIATKSYAYTSDGVKHSVEKALHEMGVEQIAMFLLHEQESEHTLRGHADAVKALIRYKEEGLIQAIGISTHHIAGVLAATEAPYIDVIHPIINRSGLGICDGSAQEMKVAIETAHAAGKGIYGMKVFGGGNLLPHYAESLRDALANDTLDAIAIGMQHEDELVQNLQMFSDFAAGNPIFDISCAATLSEQKALHIDFWCEGCGKCVDRCAHKALFLHEGKAVPDTSRCVLCGYCASVCPVFAIKVY